MCLRSCRGCHSVWFERLWVKFFKRDFRLWNPEDWDVAVHLSGELVTCASVTEMFLSQQCFENKILQGSGDSKALQRHLVPFCVDHCFLNHKDWTWLPAPIGIRHFSGVPMWIVFSSIHWNFTGTKKIVKSEVLAFRRKIQTKNLLDAPTFRFERVTLDSVWIPVTYALL